MAKRIEAQEVIQPDIFKNTIASANEAEAALKGFSGELGRVIKLQAEIGNSTKRNAKGYQELAAAEERSKAALTEKEKIDRRILTVQQQLTQVNKLQRDRLAALSVEQQRRNKISKQEAQLTNENLNAYERLQVKIKVLSDRYRSLIASEGKETAQSKLLRKEILALNAVRDKSNQALGMHQNKVGQYGRSLNKLTSTLASLGLAFGVFSLLRNTLGIMSDFEKATASLSAITGATGTDLESLKGTILDLATEMKVGVTETTKLFEIVGSQMPQLLKDAEGLRMVSESSIILSKASGESIESSTLAMASVMNQFSLEATEANRVMNVLAAGSLVGSAGISDVSEAMKNFGSVAAGANITVEESVSLIEVLGKFGVVGAEAGTKLRGSILKLQQAGVGYASGQFKVNDALEEAKAKMDALGSAAEKDAFLQKMFGAENIATGRILLSNIGLFNEYTKGVTDTNVATEQAAINSDTMSTVIKELKAAWENLVVKWSEGTDVLGGLKSVLRFLADNLEEIIGWVVHAITVWQSYRLALMLWNKEGTGIVQVLKSMVTPIKKTGDAAKDAAANAAKAKIGFAGWVGILVALLPLLWDMAKATYEMYAGTSALDKVTEKYNEQITEERAKMDLLRYAILTTNAGSKERQKVIDEINATYGTTLQNLEDETAFMDQLWEAYKRVNAEMEKRIMQKLLEEELTNLFKAKREIEKMSGGETLFGGGGQDKFLTDVNNQIAELQAEMFKLNQETASTGKTLTRLNRKDRSVKELGNDAKETKKEVEDLRTEIEKMDVTKLYPEEKRLQGVDVSQFDPKSNWLVDAMVSATSQIENKQKELINSIRESIRNTMTMISDMMQANSDMLDNQIAKQNQILDQHISKEQELRDIAKERGLDATESIDAEREAQKKARAEIDRLEQKKRNLEMMIAAMKLLSDGKSLGEIKENLGQIKSFVEGSFYEGTPYTIADALGRTGTRDGHIVRVDDNEAVLTGDQTRALGIGKGGNSTQDIVDKFGILGKSLRLSVPVQQQITPSYDPKLAMKLDETNDLLYNLPDKMPKYDSLFHSQVGYFEWQKRVRNKVIKTRYNAR